MTNEVLKAIEARRSCRSYEEKQIKEEELEQINFWRPQTVGEIIFNTWD